MWHAQKAYKFARFDMIADKVTNMTKVLESGAQLNTPRGNLSQPPCVLGTMTMAESTGDTPLVNADLARAVMHGRSIHVDSLSC